MHHSTKAQSLLGRRRPAARLLSGLAAGLVVFLLGAAPCRADTADEHDEEGARLYMQKQYEPALREFRAAHALNGKPRLLFNIGQCYRRLGLGPEAVDYFHRYLSEEKQPDPTIRAELNTYIEQVEAAQDRQSKGPAAPPAPEPPPRLISDEIVDLEELTSQVVADYKAGRQTSAMELLAQVKQVWERRYDPIIFYYVARTYERLGKKSEALEQYRRYLGTEKTDSPLRAQAAAQLVLLTPTPPGQRYLWPAIPLGILGIAGVATGIGLYVESDKTFTQFQQPLSEPDKRALRDRGQPLALGSTIAYGIGGGLLGTAAIFTFVGLAKGVKKKPPELIQMPSPFDAGASTGRERLLSVSSSLAVQLSSSGGLLTWQGVY